jgi:hypothetical protein
MKPIDFAKALGLGALVMALNLALLFGLGFFHDTVLEPGRTPAYYMTVYPKIGAVSAPTGAIAMLFLVGWRLAGRRPGRNPYGFALAVYAAYFAIDVGLGLAMGPVGNLLVPPFFIALSGGLVASLAGAALAARTGPPATPG